MRPVIKPSVPSWDLVLVLEALCEPPFEPIKSVDMKFLSYKSALLLALTDAKQVGDLHALSVPRLLCILMLLICLKSFL